MFFLLSKILTYVTQPLVQLSLLLLLALLLPRSAWRRTCLGLFAFFFFLFSNPFLANVLIRWWEIPAKKLSELPAKSSTAVLLAGVTASDKAPSDRVHLQRGADRIMHPVQLYKEGLVRQVIVSGGSGKLLEDSVTEAGRIARVLHYSGLPDSAVFLETRSRNTFENARFTAMLLRENAELKDKPLLLVTSAFHMRRAQACFEKAGLEVIPFSVDIRAFEPPYTPDKLFIPSQDALEKWGILQKEWMGMLAYKLMGYI